MHEQHMSAKGLINGVIAGLICWGIIIAAILWLTGCTMMGKQPELYPCVSEPRPLENVDVTIKYASLLTTDWHCRQQIKETGGKAVPILLGFYHSCATLPCDASVPDGEKPKAVMNVLPTSCGSLPSIAETI